MRKTMKKKGKRVWMYRMGNVILSYRTPFASVIKKSFGGGANEQQNKPKLKTLLFTKLPGAIEEKSLADFIRQIDIKKQDEWVDQFLRTASHDNAVLKELNNTEPQVQSGKSLNDAGKVLSEWVKKKKFAVDTIESVRKNAKYSAKELESLEKILNSESVCDVPGTLSSVSSTTFDTMTKTANVLGDFLAPPPLVDEKGNPIKRRNDTTVQLMWFPKENMHYRKGNSIAVPKEKAEYGDFMVYIEPEKYADMTAYFSDMASSTEDLLALAADGCSDSFCLKGKTHRTPYKHQVLQISNYLDRKTDQL